MKLFTYRESVYRCAALEHGGYAKCPGFQERKRIVKVPGINCIGVNEKVVTIDGCYHQFDDGGYQPICTHPDVSPERERIAGLIGGTKP